MPNSMPHLPYQGAKPSENTFVYYKGEQFEEFYWPEVFEVIAMKLGLGDLGIDLDTGNMDPFARQQALSERVFVALEAKWRTAGFDQKAYLPLLAHATDPRNAFAHDGLFGEKDVATYLYREALPAFKEAVKKHDPISGENISIPIYGAFTKEQEEKIVKGSGIKAYATTNWPDLISTLFSKDGPYSKVAVDDDMSRTEILALPVPDIWKLVLGDVGAREKVARKIAASLDEMAQSVGYASVADFEEQKPNLPLKVALASNRSSAWVGTDQKHEFSKHLKTIDGQPITPQENELLHTVVLFTKKAEVMLRTTFGNSKIFPFQTAYNEFEDSFITHFYLPHSLFEGKKEGEVISILWDDMPIDLELAQAQAPNNSESARFEKVLKEAQSIFERTPARTYLYFTDIPEHTKQIASEYFDTRTAQVIRLGEQAPHTLTDDDFRWLEKTEPSSFVSGYKNNVQVIAPLERACRETNRNSLIEARAYFEISLGWAQGTELDLRACVQSNILFFGAERTNMKKVGSQKTSTKDEGDRAFFKKMMKAQSLTLPEGEEITVKETLVEPTHGKYLFWSEPPEEGTRFIPESVRLTEEQPGGYMLEWSCQPV